MTRATYHLLLAASLAASGGSAASAEPISPSTSEEISLVDIYGLRNVSPQAVRDAIGERPELSERLIEKLRAIPGVLDVRLNRVCCVEGRSVLFVGIVEPGSPPPPPIRPRPDGEARLPHEFGQAYAEFLEALHAAVEAGRSGEDRSQGHALGEDPAVRAAQEKFIELSAGNVELLREVLETSRCEKDRAVAAHVIAYAPDKAAVLPDLLRAVSDADSTVRNNATRAIAVLTDYAGSKPEILQRIDPDPFIGMLSSPEWSDRNKAIGVLLGLTERCDSRWVGRLPEDALDSLAEMARWQSPDHARDALTLLGRVAGLNDEEIIRAWSATDRDDRIDEMAAAARPPVEDDSGAEASRVARSFIDALSTADTDALAEMLAPDATVFAPFPGTPRRVEGREAVARFFERFFDGLRENGDGPIHMKLTPRDLLVQTYGDTAVVTFHLGPPDPPPDRAYSFSRRTLVLQRSAGRWLITHLHASNIFIPAAEQD